MGVPFEALLPYGIMIALFGVTVTTTAPWEINSNG